jgi:type VI secretion system protein ImpH
MTVSLLDDLRTHPQRFDMFRALQLLERLAPAPQRGDVDLPVRFSAHQSLAFPPHEIHRVRLPTEETPGQVALNLLTLTGPAAALPQVYTEAAIRSLRDRTPGLAAFFDLFNDRIATLFYRAWQRYRLPALLERDGTAGMSAAGAALFGIAGFGLPQLRNRLAVPDELLLFHAGLFSQQPRAAISLERMLAEVFALPVEISQFVGRWIAVAPREQTALHRDGAYNRLGVDAVAGARVWDVQGNFRIVLGPMSRRRFLDFLPGRPGLRRLLDLARAFAGPELGFDVQLVLRRDEIPPCTLGQSANGPRLGYDCWLAALPLSHDPRDTILSNDR